MMLHAVEIHVRAFEQGFECGSVSRPYGNTHTDAQCRSIAIGGKPGTNSARDTISSMPIRFGEKDGELIAAVPCGDVTVPAIDSYHICEPAKRAIPCKVSV